MPEMAIGENIKVTKHLLTDECQHYSHISDIPWDIQKYWHQRHSIFSRYDDGIYMTDEAWFGVTPELVALRIASDLADFAPGSKRTVVDIFAGAGGNTIAFALSSRWARVVAVERDAAVLACAQHNAAIYGVADRITWVHADSFDLLPLLPGPGSDPDPGAAGAGALSLDPAETVVFASPPWGGPGYINDKIFDLGMMKPYSLAEVYDLCRGTECALFLPRTSDLRQIAKLAPDGRKIEVVQYCMEGASKGLVAYIPAADT